MTGPLTTSPPPRVFYVQYMNPAAYPPLEHSAHLLADGGADVRMMGTAILDGALAFKPHPRIRVELRPFQGSGWRQKLHYVAFLSRAAREALRWQPTWIYASEPLACPIALVARALSGARVIYHEHDSPDPSSVGSRFERVVRACRRRLARQATVCIVPNRERADVFVRTTGAREALTIWNCPMPEDAATPAPAARSCLRAVYHGSIVPARLPMTVIDAIAALTGVTLQIAGYETAGHSGYVQALLDLARARGCADRVTYAGTVPRREDLLRLCAAGDVGLALLPASSDDFNERTMAGASNKPFDYLACGLPVIVADRPEWVDMFVRGGYGLACRAESADSIAEALAWCLAHPAERRAMGERGRLKILNEWNYERLFAPVRRAILTGGAGVPDVAGMNAHDPAPRSEPSSKASVVI